ncbi:MAG TPA: hypothetical protein VFP85_11185, partial [Vicinamibacterales bacterium]|nr:hypothetical protein [Vicinamibacterales bacterium]
MTVPLDFAGFALLGIALMTAILLVVMLVRIVKVASGRNAARRGERNESAVLSMALQEALVKLKAQERATAARADASQRLADQIVEGLTSGLVVVDRAGMVQSVNPAARRNLDLQGDPTGRPFREALAGARAMTDLIGEALQGGSPILRRSLALGDTKSQHLGVTV